MKKILKLFSVSVLSCLMVLCLVVPVSAEDTNTQIDNIYLSTKDTKEGFSDSFIISGWNFSYFENDSIIKIDGKDLKGEKSETIIHKSDGTFIDNGSIKNQIRTINNRGVYGPFKTHFDINPSSVGDVIGSIMAVSAFVATAGTAGIGWTALKAGVTKLFSIAGGGDLVNRWVPNARVHGYFQYSQETDLGNCRARNLNRKLVISFMNNPYDTYNYGDGSWFETSRECY